MLKKIFLCSLLAMGTSMYGAQEHQDGICSVKEGIADREGLVLIVRGLEGLVDHMNPRERAEFDSYKFNIKKLTDTLPMLKENLNKYEKNGNQKNLCEALFVISTEYEQLALVARWARSFTGKLATR